MYRMFTFRCSRACVGAFEGLVKIKRIFYKLRKIAVYFFLFFYEQNRLYPRIRQASMIRIVKKLFSIKNMILMPIAIQNKMNPNILFIVFTTPFVIFYSLICTLRYGIIKMSIIIYERYLKRMTEGKVGNI